MIFLLYFMQFLCRVITFTCSTVHIVTCNMNWSSKSLFIPSHYTSRVNGLIGIHRDTMKACLCPQTWAVWSWWEPQTWPCLCTISSHSYKWIRKDSNPQRSACSEKSGRLVFLWCPLQGPCLNTDSKGSSVEWQEKRLIHWSLGH